jgi:hypothetical protein
MTLLERFHDYRVRSGLREEGLFSVKSPVRGIFTGYTYRETALSKSGLAVLLAGALMSTSALAAALIQTATLKDLQTVGSTTKKQKHQQYDLVIDTMSNEYVCRSKLGNSLKPTQFVVGSTVEFKQNGQNGEVKNSAGNNVKCGIVRVGALSSPQ